MRLHVILERDGRLKADWSCLDKLGEAVTVLVISDDSLGKLAEADRDRFTRIVRTDDFTVPNLAALLRGLIDELAGGDHAGLLLSTVDETVIMEVAGLRELFGIPGQRPAEAAGFVDKLEMKRRVATAGVGLPGHERFDAIAYDADPAGYLDGVVRRLGESLFVKPTDQAGSMGTARIRSRAELAGWAGRADRSYSYEIDEFVTGTLFHVDSIVSCGQIRYAMVGEYTHPNAEFLNGRTLGSIALDPGERMFGPCAELNTRVLAALGASDGVYHLELFRRDGTGELVFLEVAARPAGAMVPEMYVAAYGLNLHDATFAIQLGDGGFDATFGAATGTAPARRRYAVWSWVPPVPGTVIRRQDPETVGELDLYWRCAEGDVLRAPSFILERVAGILVTAPDRATARADFEYLRDRYRPLTIQMGTAAA